MATIRWDGALTVICPSLDRVQLMNGCERQPMLFLDRLYKSRCSMFVGSLRSAYEVLGVFGQRHSVPKGNHSASAIAPRPVYSRL